MADRASNTTRRITSHGSFLLLATAVAAVAAWSHVDAFGLVFAGLAAVVVASGVFAFVNLRGLDVAIDVPTEVRVGEAMAFDLTIDVGWPLLAPEDVQVRVAFDGRAARPLAFVARFRRGESLTLRGAHRFGLRGRRETANVTFVSAAPFGWFEVERTLTLPVRVLVMPAFDRLRNADALWSGALEAARRGRRVRSEEHLAAVRPWRIGESERAVHWKLTAKRGVRVAREFETTSRAAMHIVVVTAVDGVRVRTHWAFERCVRLAASLIEHFHAQSHPVRLTILAATPTTFVAARHRHGTRAMQRELAVIAPRYGVAEATTIPSDATCVVHAGARVASRQGLVALDVTQWSTIARWVGFAGRSWRPLA